MAYNRNLAIRAQRYSKQQFISSFSYLRLKNDDRRKVEAPKVYKFGGNGFLGSGSNCLLGFGVNSRYRGYSEMIFPNLRHMSSISTGEYVSDMINEMKVALESAVAEQAPAITDVAIAAADSSFFSALIQNDVNDIHIDTGFNWWASIALTTLKYRVYETPFFIYRVELAKKVEALLPSWLRWSGHDHAKTEELRRQSYMGAAAFCVPANRVYFLLFNFFALKNMVEYAPSLKSGGIYWFIDLTTPDSSYVLPVLTAITYWMSVEGYKLMTSNFGVTTPKENSVGTVKIMQLTRIALIPLLIGGLPKAFFFCWIPSFMYTFLIRLAMESATAKRFLSLKTQVTVKGIY